MRVIWCIWMDDASLNRIKKARNLLLFLFTHSLTHSKSMKAPFSFKILFQTHLAWKIHPFYVFNGNSFVSTQTRWQHYRYWLMLVLCFHKLRENKKNQLNKKKQKNKKYEFHSYLHVLHHPSLHLSSAFVDALENLILPFFSHSHSLFACMLHQHIITKGIHVNS